MAKGHIHPSYGSFRFDAGSLALNFVATVRHRGSKPRDLLSTPEALDRWFQLACYKSGGIASSVQDHEEALLLREAIYRTIRSLILGKKPMKKDIDRINLAAEYSRAIPEINRVSCMIRWKSEHPVRSCLADIAQDAAMVIGGADRQRLKMCSNGSCQMLFFDHSPVNRRRWCAMTICGNREKIKVYRQKQRSSDA